MAYKSVSRISPVDNHPNANTVRGMRTISGRSTDTADNLS